MRPLLSITFAVAAALATVAPGWTGGALVYDTAGAPVVWDAAAPVPYTLDAGGLGTLDATAAHGLVNGMFKIWADVPTATIDYTQVATLADADDIDGSNYGPYLGPYAGFLTPRGENVIVFDADGAIFDDLFGVGSGVLGFAGPVFFSDGTTTGRIGSPVPAGSHVIEGLAFLNGKFIDGIDSGSNFEVSLEMFAAVFVHEFGHFSGLDHTQIHAFSEVRLASGSYRNGVTETMYPYMVSVEQGTPTFDDRTAISRLYPTAGFTSGTGCVSGTLFDTTGQRVSGANVIAYSDDETDFTSAVSGPSGQAGDLGQYRLCGLAPGVGYHIEVQEIDAATSGGSGVGPFDPPITLPGQPEGWNAPYESTDPALDDPGATRAVVAVAGADLAGHDIHLNEQRFDVLNWRWGSGTVRDQFIGTPSSFALADFDSDGKLDIVSVQTGFQPDNVVRFSHGLGNGLFDLPVTVDEFPGNQVMVSGKFHAGADSHRDVIVASATTAQVNLYLGNGDGTFVAPPTTLVPGSPSSLFAVQLVSCDVDGNGTADAVFLQRGFVGGPLLITSLLANSGGGFSAVTTTVPEAAGLLLAPFTGVVCGQFAGSSAGDLLFPLLGSPQLGLLTGDGAGGFVPSLLPVPSVTSRLGSAIAAADFDGDGRLDVAVSDLSSNYIFSDIQLLRGDGAGGFTYSSRYTVDESFQASMVVGDFDRDGRLDLASAGSSGLGRPGSKVNVAYGDGAGGIRAKPAQLFGSDVSTTWGVSAFPATSFPDTLQAGDLDGDGRLDLVVADAPIFGVPRFPEMTTLLGKDLPFNRARRFFTLTPCRLIDTRDSATPLATGIARTFVAGGTCGVPASARAVAANVTVVGATGEGFLTLYPGPLGPAPTVSNINFRGGSARANNATLALAPDGTGSFRVVAAVTGGGTVHCAIDVVGYYE